MLHYKPVLHYNGKLTRMSAFMTDIPIKSHPLVESLIYRHFCHIGYCSQYHIHVTMSYMTTLIECHLSILSCTLLTFMTRF